MLDYPIALISSYVKTKFNPIVDGVIEEPDEEIVGSPTSPLSLKGVNRIVDLDNQPTYNQRNTPHCAVYGTLLDIETLAIAKYYDKSISFDREYYSAILRKEGLLSDKGAYISKIAKWFGENGCVDRAGRKYVLPKPEHAKRADIGEILTKGLPVISGGKWGWPYHDKNNIWIPQGRDGFGHCTLFNGFAPEGTLILDDGSLNDEDFAYTETSWGNRFGIKKHPVLGTGRLYVRSSDFDKIFTPYFFTDVTRI